MRNQPHALFLSTFVTIHYTTLQQVAGMTDAFHLILRKPCCVCSWRSKVLTTTRRRTTGACWTWHSCLSYCKELSRSDCRVFWTWCRRSSPLTASSTVLRRLSWRSTTRCCLPLTTVMRQRFVYLIWRPLLTWPTDVVFRASVRSMWCYATVVYFISDWQSYHVEFGEGMSSTVYTVCSVRQGMMLGPRDVCSFYTWLTCDACFVHLLATWRLFFLYPADLVDTVTEHSVNLLCWWLNCICTVVMTTWHLLPAGLNIASMMSATGCLPIISGWTWRRRNYSVLDPITDLQSSRPHL